MDGPSRDSFLHSCDSNYFADHFTRDGAIHRIGVAKIQKELEDAFLAGLSIIDDSWHSPQHERAIVLCSASLVKALLLKRQKIMELLICGPVRMIKNDVYLLFEYFLLT